MRNKIEHRGIKAQYNKNKISIDKGILTTVKKSNFIEGEEVKELEKRLAKFVGVKHCITCGNGTDALYLILKSLNIGKGDYVMVPAFTFFATAEAIAMCGAIPIFVDVDFDTYNVSEKSILNTITNHKEKGKPNIKAIIAVDLFGQCADYKEILPILKENNILLIEDGAQSFGAKIKNRYALSFGVAGAVSFFPTKPLGSYGDGGAVFTNSTKISNFIRSFKAHGAGKDKYNNIRVGINSRLDTIQASILLEKLKVFKKEQKRINKIAKEYNKYLSSYLKTPYIKDGFTSVYAQYTIKFKNIKQRDFLKKYLGQNNIPVHIYYKTPIHLQPVFNSLGYKKGDIPVSELLSNTVLSIPIHPYLTKKEQKHIISTLIKGIKEFYNQTKSDVKIISENK